MGFFKIPKIISGFIIFSVLVNLACLQIYLPDSCRVEDLGSEVADATNRVNQDCHISFQVLLQPIPSRGQFEIQMWYQFAGIYPSNLSEIRISIFNDSRNLGLPDCSVVDGLTRVQPPFRVKAFRDKSGDSIYKKHLVCSTVEGLLPGNYCSRTIIYDRNGDPCIPIYSPMTVLPAYVVPEPLQAPTDYTPHYIGIGVVLLLALLGLFAFFLVRCHHPGGVLVRTGQKVFKALLSDSCVPVFLVYYPDCPHHVEVVEQLANFLNCNNCTVSYDVIEKELMARNKVGWLEQKLNGSHKILIVNSRQAFRLQNQWLANEDSNDAGDPSSTFVMALANIRHNTQMAYDYKNVFMLRPSYLPCRQLLSGIVPSRHYDLPGDLPVLLRNLHRPSSIDEEAQPADDAWNGSPLAHASLCDAIDRMLTTEGDDRASDECQLCAAPLSIPAVATTSEELC